MPSEMKKVVAAKGWGAQAELPREAERQGGQEDIAGRPYAGA